MKPSNPKTPHSEPMTEWPTPGNPSPNQVLLVSTYFPPDLTGIAPYAGDIATDLRSHGFHLRVIAAAAHYPQWKYDTRPPIWKRSTAIDGETRLRVFLPREQTTIQRGAYEASFAALGTLALIPEPQADLVFAFMPGLASGLIAATAARLWRVPLIIDLQDLSAAGASQFGVTSSTRALQALHFIEAQILSRAQHIIVPSPAFRNELLRLGIDKQAISVIRNWTRLAAQEPTISSLPARQADAGQVTVLHAGNIGKKQGLEALVDYAMAATAHGLPLHFKVIGDGSQRDTLAAAASGLTNLTILGPVDEHRLRKELSSADILLLHEGPGVRDAALPSKLTAYFAAGRPVAAVVHSTGASGAEIRRSSAGVVIEDRTPIKVVTALAQLAADRDRCSILAQNGQSYVERELSAEARLAEIRSIISATICKT